MAKAMTFYKVMGGLLTAFVIGNVGSVIGSAVGGAVATEEEKEKRQFYGQGIGAGIASSGSVLMGIRVGRMPGLKSAGIAQAIYSGAGLILVGVALALGHPLIEETLASKRLTFVAPPMLIGRIIPMKERRKGVPREDIERAREHFAELTTGLSDEQVAELLRVGEITLPKRGRGLLDGRAAS